MRLKIVAFCVLAAAASHSAPFVTPSMMKRNGLTDEQYELLWKQGVQPQIEVAAAREWIFRASRYQNVTNWLDLIGSTNNFARLSYRLQDENFVLVETNRTIKAVNAFLVQAVSVLSNDLNTLYISLTNQTALAQAAERARQLADEARVLAEKRKGEAEGRLASVKAQIQAKRDEYQEKYNKGTIVTKPIYKAIVAVFDSLLKLFN